jgi:hypothetical protein
MGNRLSFFKTPKGFLVLCLLIVSLIGLPLTVLLVRQQQTLQQNAWFTAQSASSYCDTNGNAVISVQFTNTEPSGTENAMNVTAKDLQTGSQVSIGVVNLGETKSGTIPTSSTSLQAGIVKFTLTWANGTPGTDSRSAPYSAVAACPVVSPTPTITPTPTLTPTETPAPTPTPTPTLTPTDTPTPTVTEASTPTPITSATNTPDSTTNVTNAPTNTPTPTQIAESKPTLPPTGPSTTLIHVGFGGILIAIIGGLLLFGL